MIQDIVMILSVVLIMGGLFLHTKKTNPDNRRKTTYYATEDVFHKEICPRCNVKMKRTWKKEAMGGFLGVETIQREFKALPIYTCPKCGHKIEKNKK